LGIYLIGYGDREEGAAGIHDDLTATVLALDDGHMQLAVIALDMLCLNEHVVARIREDIAAAGIAPAHVLIAASHTHAAPIAYADETSPPLNRRFIDGLVTQVVQTAYEALEALAPSRVVWGHTETPIALNRREHLTDGRVVIGRNPAGFVDRGVDVLQFRDLKGHPQATLVNLACHAVVLGPDNLLVSADWPGAMRREVEAATGAHALFLQGASGNLNPKHDWGDHDMDAVKILGNQVATHVLDLLARPLTPLNAAPLAGTNERLWLDVVPSPRSEAGESDDYHEVLGALFDVDPRQVDTLLDARYPWRSVVRQAEEGATQIGMEIQALRLGECAIVAHAAETFSELGAAIRQSSPATPTLFSGYSNGCVGYLPTAEAHAAGGYEVEITPYVYHLSGLLAPDAGERAVQRSLKLLHNLWNHS
jgi:hypothetical protein